MRHTLGYNMRSIDYIIFSLYLVMVIGIGILCRSKKHSVKEFFLAGRSLGWFPVGISIMVTAFSAINFNSFPTEVIGYGFYVVTSIPIFFLVALPIVKIFIPFFYKLNSASAYEFLEKRFNVNVRCLASGLFIFWRTLWMSVILYSTAQILSLITNINLPWLIIICGLTATGYTAFGGIRAVIWTDVAQFAVLFGGILFAVIFTVMHIDNGIHGTVDTALQGGLFKPFIPFDPKYFSFDPTIRISFWSCLIGVFVAFLIRYGADQMVIQRYLTTKSLKAAQAGFCLNIICAVISISLLAAFGVVIYAYSVDNNIINAGEKLINPLKHMAILIKSFKYGGCGLLAAGLIAATMSSIDSGINACSAAYFCDFHQRFLSKNKNEDQKWRFSVLLSLILGILSILMALSCIVLLGNQKSVFVIVNKVVNGLGSPLLAIILLAIYSKKIKPMSVFRGGIAGIILSIIVIIFVSNLALHYYAVVNLLITLLACYIFNIFEKKRNIPH